MTNLGTITGGLIWTVVAGILMMATFEPIGGTGKDAAATAPVLAAAATAHKAA